MSARRRVPSGNLVLLILLGIALGIVLLLGSFLYAMRLTFGGGEATARSLEQITDRTNVAFPPGSALIDGVVCRTWHSYAFAKVAIPPEQVPAFWRQSLFQQGPNTRFAKGSFQGLAGPRLINEWKLWTVKDYRYNSGGQFDGGGAVEALISLDDPARPILYLYWWTG